MSFFWIDDAVGSPTFSYVTFAEAAVANITIPASAQSGDFAVLFDTASSSGSPPTLVTPSGWTNRLDAPAGTLRTAVHTKQLTGGDPGASIAGMDGNFSDQKIMLVFRPSQPIVSATVSTLTSEVTNTDPASQQALASGQAAPVIVLAGCRSNNTLSFTTASPAFDGDIASSSNQRIGYKIYNPGSTPADHTIDIGDTGAQNVLWAGYVTFT